MGAAGSVLPTTEEDALEMGYTQEQIDEYKAKLHLDEPKDSLSGDEDRLDDSAAPAMTTTHPDTSTSGADAAPSGTIASADTTTTHSSTSTVTTRDEQKDVIDEEDIIEVKVRPIEERMAELGPASINVNRESTCQVTSILFAHVCSCYSTHNFAARLEKNVEEIRNTVANTMVDALKTYKVRSHVIPC